MVNKRVMELLSDEILLYCFSFLRKTDLATAARLCKRFQRIVYDDYLWKPWMGNTGNMLEVFMMQRRMSINVPVPKYVIAQKKVPYRTKYIRSLYWFYTKELKRGGETRRIHLSYPLIHVIKQNFMIEALEKTGCVPQAWIREYNSKKFRVNK